MQSGRGQSQDVLSSPESPKIKDTLVYKDNPSMSHIHTSNVLISQDVLCDDLTSQDVLSTTPTLYGSPALTLGTYLGCPEYPGILSIRGSEVPSH